MEVIDILSHYIDKTQNLIIVEFRMLGDDDDIVREDFIEYSFFEEFGFDKNKNFDIFESLVEETDEDDEDLEEDGGEENEEETTEDKVPNKVKDACLTILNWLKF